MTTILAIETTTELASAALFVEDQMFTRELSGVQTHSQGILPAIQSLLAEAKLALSDCDAIAFGANLPVLPVVSLQSMALAAAERVSMADFVCVLDARMNEVYWAHYHFSGNDCVELSPPALSRLDEVLVSTPPDSTQIVLGNGLALPEQLRGFAHVNLMPHAIQVAKIGLHGLQAGLSVAPEEAQPLYLRNKIALTTAERTMVKASS